MVVDKEKWLKCDHLSIEKSLEVSKMDMFIQEAIDGRVVTFESLQGLIHDLNVLYQGTRQFVADMAKDAIFVQEVAPIDAQQAIMSSISSWSQGEEVEVGEPLIMEQEDLDAIASWVEYASTIAPPPEMLVDKINQFLDMISPVDDEESP